MLDHIDNLNGIHMMKVAFLGLSHPKLRSCLNYPVAHIRGFNILSPLIMWRVAKFAGVTILSCIRRLYGRAILIKDMTRIVLILSAI